jgi:hypothetical protein
MTEYANVRLFLGLGVWMRSGTHHHLEYYIVSSGILHCIIWNVTRVLLDLLQRQHYHMYRAKEFNPACYSGISPACDRNVIRCVLCVVIHAFTVRVVSV